MGIVKLVVTIIVAIVVFPLNWYAAYLAGSWFDIGASVMIPTYGLLLWGAKEIGLSHFFAGWISFVGGMILGTFLISMVVVMNKDVA